jgi:hypothetical protein
MYIKSKIDDDTITTFIVLAKKSRFLGKNIDIAIKLRKATTSLTCCDMARPLSKERNVLKMCKAIKSKNTNRNSFCMLSKLVDKIPPLMQIPGKKLITTINKDKIKIGTCKGPRLKRKYSSPSSGNVEKASIQSLLVKAMLRSVLMPARKILCLISLQRFFCYTLL